MSEPIDDLHLDDDLHADDDSPRPRPRRRRRPQPPASPARKAATWIMGIAVTAGVVWMLVGTTRSVPSALRVSPHDAEDTAEAQLRCGGSASGAICGTIRVAPELQGQEPAGGAIFVHVRGAELGSNAIIATLKLPPSNAPIRYRVDKTHATNPAALGGEIDVEVHWSATGDPFAASPGDLKGECAKSPLRPGDRIANLVLGERVP